MGTSVLKPFSAQVSFPQTLRVELPGFSANSPNPLVNVSRVLLFQHDFRCLKFAGTPHSLQSWSLNSFCIIRYQDNFSMAVGNALTDKSVQFTSQHRCASDAAMPGTSNGTRIGDSMHPYSAWEIQVLCMMRPAAKKI